MSHYDVLANGTLAALNETVEIAAGGLSTIGVGVSGAGWAGTITVEGNIGDGVWHILPMIDALTGAAVVSTAANGAWHVGIAGYLTVRIHAFAWVAGTATIFIEGTSATAGVFLSRSIPTGVNNIGDVDVATIAAGETHIGEVGGHCITADANPVLSVAGAYVAGDFVGTSSTGITFSNVVRVAGGSGVIESAVLVDKALQSASVELWLFDTAVAGLPLDNAPFTITDASALTLIGVIPFQVYYASALNSVSSVKGLGMTFNATASDIYGALVTRGTPTLASLDYLIRLQILAD
jgi:hypothetical protein